VRKRGGDKNKMETKKQCGYCIIQKLFLDLKEKERKRDEEKFKKVVENWKNGNTN
jgi:hypothetical protein